MDALPFPQNKNSKMADTKLYCTRFHYCITFMLTYRNTWSRFLDFQAFGIKEAKDDIKFTMLKHHEHRYCIDVYTDHTITCSAHLKIFLLINIS